jgi:hypothetical protein
MDGKTASLFNRKRRDTPEKMFNELIEDIVDSCIKYDLTKLFHQPVKKKDYPDYYTIIKNPIDLTQMKNKTKRCEYLKVQELINDLDLLVNNSMIYNGDQHEVTLQAVMIRENAINKIQE